MNYPLEGKCLFYSNASWMYNLWFKLDSSKYKNMIPTEYPVFKQSPICFGGYFVIWAVLKKSPNRERAIRFLLSVNTPDVAEKWVRYNKSPTGIKGNLTTYNFGLDKF
jgi:ABC-type glycerol-3-phosphate transport system substrate-binding protein